MDLENPAQHASVYSFLDFTFDLATERLLRGSEEIKLRPKSFHVLSYLIQHHGRLVTREELLRVVWDEVVVTDESVTKCVTEIRKALSDESQEIIRTVPKRGFVFQAGIHLIEGVSKTSQVPSPGPSRRFSGRRAMLFVGGAMAGLALVLVALESSGNLSGRKPLFEAIAVLPFESLSASPDQQYVADGLTEALITNLGQASPLRVIARTSVNQYQRSKKSVREIARELNVDVLLEGTVAQSAGRLRVTANLIQVSPEKHIWAHSYERDLRDVLALQNEVAAAIAAEIQGKLTPRQQSRLASSRPVNPEAQLAYWKARYFLNSRKDRIAVRKGLEYAEQAVRIDPDYAPAQAALAMAYTLNSDAIGANEAMPRAKKYAQRAITLDEELAEAHVALGTILLTHDWDWVGAEREARRALSLNPSDADAHWLLAEYLAAIGRVDEALMEIKQARELYPFSIEMNRNVGRMLCFARKYDEALTELRQAGDMRPNSSAVDVWIVRAHLMKGSAREAVETDLRVHAYRDGFASKSLDALRAAYSTHGLRGYWTKLKELATPEFRSKPEAVYRLAEISAYLGDKDEAFRWLEKAYEYRTMWVPWIKVDPSLDALRSDPRFDQLLRRMGLTPRI